jgi:hypothetical protein
MLQFGIPADVLCQFCVALKEVVRQKRISPVWRVERLANNQLVDWEVAPSRNVRGDTQGSRTPFLFPLETALGDDV